MIEATKKLGVSEFKKLINILEKNNKEYMAIAGTALGSVYFQGMIPWDDDIDISISYETFNFLKKNYPNNIVCSNDKGYPLIFPKWVPDKNNFSKSPVFIDLFISVRTNKKNIKKFTKFSRKAKFGIYSLTHGYYPQSFAMKILKAILYPFKFLANTNLTIDESYKILYDKNGKKRILIVNPADPIRMADISVLDGWKYKKLPFDGLLIKVPTKYKEYFDLKYKKLNLNVKKKRNIEIHVNAFNIIKAKWNGNKILYKESDYMKAMGKK